MGQTQGRRIFTKDNSLSKEEHRERYTHLFPLKTLRPCMPTSVLTYPCSLGRLQQHRWRTEVGPEDAPANRPPPPFSLRAVTVGEFVRTQRELIVVPSTSTVGMA